MGTRLNVTCSENYCTCNIHVHTVHVSIDIIAPSLGLETCHVITISPLLLRVAHPCCCITTAAERTSPTSTLAMCYYTLLIVQSYFTNSRVLVKLRSSAMGTASSELDGLRNSVPHPYWWGKSLWCIVLMQRVVVVFYACGFIWACTSIRRKDTTAIDSINQTYQGSISTNRLLASWALHEVSSAYSTCTEGSSWPPASTTTMVPFIFGCFCFPVQSATEGSGSWGLSALMSTSNEASTSEEGTSLLSTAPHWP